jgi:hypothetical protein
MAGLLEAILGQDTNTVDQLRVHTGNDAHRAEQAYCAAVGTILRGLEAKTKTAEGRKSIWDTLRKHVEKGTVPPDMPSGERGVHVKDMDPTIANEMLKAIFGKDAPEVQGGFAKVITLDPETSRKVFAKVLPSVLGGIFGAAERDPEDSSKALPRIIGDARNEMEERQPKSTNVFNAIFDRDHDGDVDLEDLAGIFPRKPR